MKLTNISLAILVAIGLVACGGSDDKNNQPADNNNAGHQGAGNGNPPPPPPPPKKEVEDPSNAASGLEVEERYKTNTAVAKTIYANRSGLQRLSGYVSPDPTGKANVYESGSVSTPDILRASSVVNYLAEGWTNVDGKIRLNPFQTYAKGKDGNFYRIKKIIEVDSTGVRKEKKWDEATPNYVFEVIDAAAGQFDDANNIPATNLWFVPNVIKANNSGTGLDNYYDVVPVQLGSFGGRVNLDRLKNINHVNPNNISYGTGAGAFSNTANAFNTAVGDVLPVGVTVGDKDYSFSGTSSSAGSYKLDLNLDNATEIQTVPIKYNYSIVDTKSTSDPSDDDSAVRTTDAGALRVYNVNYSLALLEVNDAAAKNSNDPKATARNGLGFTGKNSSKFVPGYGSVLGSGKDGHYGAFQVQGFQTQALPLNGRATYRGQSFGVNSKGQIDLSVDFGEERAAIGGSITNRTTMDGKKSLDSMQLKNIYLSQPSKYSVTGSKGIDSNNEHTKNGLVDLGGQQNWGTWAVQLYGPNAENAAGVIAMNDPAAPATQVNVDELEYVVEVFNSVRTDINPKSLNNQKNP